MANLNKDEFLKIYSMFPIITSMDISKIKVPTLIIVGELEPKNMLKYAEEMKKAIRDSLVVIISKASHLSNMDNPEEFNAIIEGFLKDLNL